MKRQVYNNLTDLKNALMEEGNSRKTPYVVNFQGEQQFVLSSNADQALAAVIRSLGAKVSGLPIKELLRIGDVHSSS